MKKYINNPDEVAEDKLLRRAFQGSIVKKIDKDSRQIEFIISTPTEDRYGDIIEVKGWDLKSYKKNPVVLFGHMSSIPPIGKAVKVWKNGDEDLRAIAEFMPQDISTFAHSIFRMFEEGYLRAVSVGFKPREWERRKDEDGEEMWGQFHFKKQELLEFSAVPIPANPECLIEARQKGIDTAPFKQWAEEMLDNWNETGDTLKGLFHADRKRIENIRRRAAGSGASIRVSVEVQDDLMKKNLEAIRKWKADKENAKQTETITIFGEEFELPKIKTVGDSGTVTISQDEINGKIVTHIDKADDTARFTTELLKDESDFMSVEERDVEGDEAKKGVILTLKGDDSVVEYNLLGIGEDEQTVYGMKISETKGEEEVDQPAGENELKSESDDEGDDAEKAKKPKKPKMDDDDEDEDDKKAKKPKASDDDDEDEDDKKSAKDSATKDVDEGEDDEPLSLDDCVRLLEYNLLNIEEALDKSAGEKQTKHVTRKLEFLAGYMRELADVLDKGKGAKSVKQVHTLTAPATQTKQVQEEAEEELTLDEAQNYVKSVVDGLQPLLTEIVQSKLSKMKGSLD